MSHPIVVFFPGQGSQSIGMLDALAETYPIVRATFDEASEALSRDLWRLVTEGPAEALDLTLNTQPAMLAAGVAVWRVWRQAGGPGAELMAGHSLGEYSALVAAGALSFDEGVRLAAERAKLMQDAVPPGAGAMAAVLGLTDQQVLDLCAEQAQDGVLEAVNFNAPGQVVIAGAAEAVTRAVSVAKTAGAKRAITLSVSVPSHCALMRPAAERLARRWRRRSCGCPRSRCCTTRVSPRPPISPTCVICSSASFTHPCAGSRRCKRWWHGGSAWRSSAVQARS